MNTPFILAVAGAAFAIGVALSDSIRSSLGSAAQIPLLTSLLLRSSSSSSLADLPAQAQLVLPADFAVLPVVLPPAEANATTIFVPPGKTRDSLVERPFHVYHEDFLSIIGSDPTLTLIADSGTDPVFHEAVVWHPPTDDVFFVQSAGNPNTGTGLHKSAMIQKINLAQAMAVARRREAVGEVDVVRVESTPQVINPNGATNYKGNILFTGEGMGDRVPPALYAMNPLPPHNTTVLINNYHGRQFNSLNDVAVSPRKGGFVYFTDVTYGERQDFRPRPVLPNQVYRFDPARGGVAVVADGFDMCNGITISPDGRFAYVTDTGANQAFYGYQDHYRPATIYRFNIADDGTFENRKVFAHVTTGVPDGVHCDSLGNVYAGCDDGVHVWNPSGTLLGKIFTGDVAANFQFAGHGRMVICGETRLYYATLAAEGAPLA